MTRAWVMLGIAGLLEVGWAIGLKYSDGFRKPLASTLTLITLTASFWLLAQALKTLPVGTGYAVWTGIGAVGTAILGIVLFDEPRNAGRILSILLIVAGIAGLRLTAR
jgi:quaternary ammonium compound-resistance protein SugE